MATIVFNGQEYESIDAMPAEIRRLYEQVAGMLADADGDGMPDAFQQTMQAQVMTASQYVVDGQVYHRLEDLPPEARRRYEQAMAQFDTNQDGVPDMLAGVMGGAPVSAHPAESGSPAPLSSATTIPTVRVVGESSPESRVRMLTLAVVVLLVVVAGLAYLLLVRWM